MHIRRRHRSAPKYTYTQGSEPTSAKKALNLTLLLTLAALWAVSVSPVLPALAALLSMGVWSEAGSPLAVHADWIDGLIKKYGTGLKREKAEAVLRDEIGIVFSHVLENAGVFKQDAAGQAAFLKFMESVGYRKA